VEVSGLFRRARSMAFAIPRQLAEIANSGSIENAHEEIRSADARRRIESALEQTAEPAGNKPSPNEAN